jgi:signal transduction histidine kinase
MLHYDGPDDLIGSIADIATQYYVDPRDRDRYQNLLQQNGKVDGLEFRVKCKDGAEIWVANSTRAYFDENGAPTHYEGVVSDITTRKRTQQALRESGQRFRELFNNMRAGVVICDSRDDGAHVVVRDMNEAGLQILVQKKDAVVDRDIQTVFPGIAASGLINTFRRVWRTAVSERHPASPFTVNGQPVWIENFVYRLSSGELVAIYEDVTARREAEEAREALERQIRQAQKMEAIGTLAGGIAHDFNNILFPLIGYAEMLQMDIPPDSPLQKYVDQILKAALRSRDLVTQILSFSRQSDQETRPLHIQPIIKEVLKLLRSSIPTTIAIETAIDPDCGMVLADPTQVHQIIMNLATNAYHAMETTGGVLRVSIETVRISPPEPFDTHLLPGDYVCLTVADTGSGIKPDLLEKIFDPYFTTKEKGKGTGLGLSVVRGIIRHCRGDIRVISTPGTGTKMQVYLPIIERHAVEQSEIVGLLTKGGSERILFVDDEEGVVRMMTLMLERLGYAVTSRTGSLDALETFKTAPDRFDLVITDMTMPNMNGVQLATEIRSIRPTIPIIICTGFSDQIDDARCRRMGLQGLVKKPVITRVIAETIRTALGDGA